MEDMTKMLVKHLDEFETWLKEQGIVPKEILEHAPGNERKILTRAYRRVRKGWNLTKAQLMTIEKWSDPERRKKHPNPYHLNAPDNCPYYYSNWNMDGCCKLTDDYCYYDLSGCEEYAEIYGPLKVSESRKYEIEREIKEAGD